MDCKQIKIDGNDVLRDSMSGIYYAQKEWRQLTTDDTSTNITGYHGRTTSPTYARKRVITIGGYVQRIGNANEQVAVQYLQNLFNLQWDTSTLTPRVLYIKDTYDNEWTLDVKVSDPIEFLEYSDDWRGIVWKWQVVLESIEDPRYKGYVLKQNNGTEGNYGGVKFPVKFPVKFNSIISYIECVTAGNTATPARIEITATNAINSPLRVLDATHNKFFAIDTDAVAGDVIVIDSNTQTITKNGVSIKSKRLPGSIFPMIERTTKLVVEDADGGLPFSDFTIKVFFRDALLA